MPEGDEPGNEPTYTPPKSQEDFDRIVEGRLARERSKYADYDTLKEKAGKFDEVQTASQTELERLQTAIADKDKALNELPGTVRKQAIRFASLASQKGFLDPEDALVFVGDVDLDDEAAVKAALDSLAERKPHLVTQEKAKRKVGERPKPKAGEPADGSDDGDLKGKERAAAALRGFRSTSR